MKAITTKYISLTNTKPARIKASAEGVRSVTIGYHSHSNQWNNPHLTAAMALCAANGWKGSLASGGLPDQSGEVFCFVEAHNVFEIVAEVVA